MMTTGTILGPLRVVACNGTYQDPALDVDRFTAEMASQYIRTADPSVLPMREGVKPQVFTLARLPATYLASLSALATLEKRRIAALLGALRSVGVDGEPPVIEVLPPNPKPPEGSRWVGAVVDGCLVAPPEIVQEIADLYGYETVMQLGHWALEHARLPRAARGPFSWWGGAAPSR